MNVLQLVNELDKQVLSGDILGAFDRFFAEECVTFSGPEDKTTNKTEKRQMLQRFLDSMTGAKRIEHLGTKVDGDAVTFSEFVFDFHDAHGNNHHWHEVLRRVWRDGKVVEEQYYTNLPKENPMLEKKAKAAKPAAEKAAKPAAKKAAEKPAKPAAEKAAKPAAEKKPAAGVSKKK